MVWLGRNVSQKIEKPVSEEIEELYLGCGKLGVGSGPDAPKDLPVVHLPWDFVASAGRQGLLGAGRRWRRRIQAEALGCGTAAGARGCCSGYGSGPGASLVLGRCYSFQGALIMETEQSHSCMVVFMVPTRF